MVKNIFTKLLNKIVINKKTIIFLIIQSVVSLVVLSFVFKGYNNKIHNLKEQVKQSYFNKVKVAEKSNNVSLDKSIKDLKKSYRKYKQATKEELIVKWINFFSRSSYKLDGNLRYGQYDCSGALVTYLRFGWNSYVKFESVKQIKTRVEREAKLQRINIRRSIKQVKPGDIIIFKPNKRGYWHCGLVYDVSNGNVLYMDVNSSAKGMWFGIEKWGSSRISMVFEVTYAYWIGDLLKN